MHLYLDKPEDSDSEEEDISWLYLSVSFLYHLSFFSLSQFLSSYLSPFLFLSLPISLLYLINLTIRTLKKKISLDSTLLLVLWIISLFLYLSQFLSSLLSFRSPFLFYLSFDLNFVLDKPEDLDSKEEDISWSYLSVIFFFLSFLFIFFNFSFSVSLSLSSDYECTGRNPVQASAMFLNKKELSISRSLCFFHFLSL